MTRRPVRTIPLAALVALGLVGCESTPTAPSPALDTLPRQLSATEVDIIGGSNSFAFDLFAAINEHERDQNVFISPLSLSMALGMTMNGAAGTTFDEMRDVLGFAGLTQDEINTGYRDLLALLVNLDPRVEIALGNSIWAREGVPFEPAFFHAVQTNFDAEVQTLDFSDPASVGRINDWVDEATDGRIHDIIDQIEDRDVMFLINAIYFDGDWRQRFDPAKTHADTFTGPGGDAIPIQMMTTTGSFRFGSGIGYQAVELPYGNGAFTMTLLLPSPETEVDDLIAELDDEFWGGVVDRWVEGSVEVSLPRFELEYEKSLKDPLRELGMVSAFVPGGADFTRMSSDWGKDLFVSAVEHKSFVKVNEEGTEAAAATSVTASVTSAQPQLARIRFDRPFIFAIRERFSGAILFVGKIVAPSE